MLLAQLLLSTCCVFPANPFPSQSLRFATVRSWLDRWQLVRCLAVQSQVHSLGTLAGRVGEGPESGRASSLELVCRGMTGRGGGTEAAGLAEVGEVAWRRAQPRKAVTPLGLIK